MARTKQTLLERYTTHLQNHRFVSLVILLGLVVIGIASFTDAVSRIVDLGGRLLGPSHSKSDQWTTVLRVKNRGPEAISIERLCEPILRKLMAR